MATTVPKPTQAQQHIANKLMRVLMFTMAISMMSGAMFNIALPQISREFQLPIAGVSWLSSSYILIYAIGAVTYGKLADRFRLKDLVTFGLLLFAIGSMVGLTSQSFAMALIGRCLQASGAAVIPAMSMIIPLRFFAPERRGAALGMTAVGLAFGNALGPVIAAFLISTVEWRWLFAVPMVSLATLPFYRAYLGQERQVNRSSFDWLGGLLLGATIALLLLSVTASLWLLLPSVLALGLFIARIRASAEPFIMPKLFQNRAYSLGLVISFLVSGACCSLYVVSPLLLADVQQLPSIWIGFAMVPAAAASALFGRMGGKLADARGNTFVVSIAASLLLTCFLLLSTFTASSPYLVALFLLLGNLGQTFITIAISNSVSRTLPADQVGVGMGMLAMANFIGQGIAISVYGKVVDLQSPAVTSWNPLNSDNSGFIFSNLYLVLAVSQIIIFVLYYLTFSRQKRLRTRLIEKKAVPLSNS